MERVKGKRGRRRGGKDRGRKREGGRGREKEKERKREMERMKGEKGGGREEKICTINQYNSKI